MEPRDHSREDNTMTSPEFVELTDFSSGKEVHDLPKHQAKSPEETHACNASPI